MDIGVLVYGLLVVGFGFMVSGGHRILPVGGREAGRQERNHTRDSRIFLS